MIMMKIELKPAINQCSIRSTENYVVCHAITGRMVETQGTMEKAVKSANILNDHAINNNLDDRYTCYFSPDDAGRRYIDVEI